MSLRENMAGLAKIGYSSENSNFNKFQIYNKIQIGMYKDIFPPIETVLEMEPEEFAPFVLRHLSKLRDINRYNYTLCSTEEVIKYAGQQNVEEFKKRLMEAFIWLEREMFIAPKPGESGEWRFITRSGGRVLKEEDFGSYARESLLCSEILDPILVRKVKPLFLRGDYDTAIFQAFKEVEIRVRKTGKYTNDEFGVDLMRKAFNPNKGKLTNKKASMAEKENKMHLFAGAIGLFKNPVSHRDIHDISPEFAADAIRFSNLLLRML